MADYRNQPTQFLNLGLNVSRPPEALDAGQWTRALNVRVTTENILEARQGTKPWVPDQLQYFSGTTRTGPHEPYPSRWWLGRLRSIRYIGKIKDDTGVEHEGYITIHDPSTDPSYTGYRVFINGTPLVSATASCSDFSAGYTPFIPRTFSVIRTTSFNGKPIVIFDGAYYVSLQQCVLTKGQENKTALHYGPLDTADVPVYYAYKLGISKPTAKPVVANNGAGNLDSTVLTAQGYYWRYSYYSNVTGFESPLSDASDLISAAAFQAKVTVVQPSDPQVTHFRVYRLGGTLTATWRLTNEVQVQQPFCDSPGATADIIDNSADVDIALATAGDIDSVEPFTSIDQNGLTLNGSKFPYAFGPFNGQYVFWVGDPARPGWVYWNNPGDVGRVSPINSAAAVADPGEVLLNGFIFGGNPFIWSSLRLYALDFGGPDATPGFAPREIPLGYGLAGRWAFAVGPNAVFFVGRDGIYATTCQGEKPISITDDYLKRLFRGEDAEDLEAVDFTQAEELRLSLAAKNLHFFYKGNSGTQYHLVFDIEKGRWFQWSQNTYTYAYLNEASAWAQTLLGVSTGPSLYLFDDSYTGSQESFSVQARTSSWHAGIPLTHKEFGVFMLDFDPGGANVTITPYYDSEKTAGTALSTDTAHDTSGRRVLTFSLGDVYAKSIALDFQWNETPEEHPIFYQAYIQFREDEEEVDHWEAIGSSFDIPGFYHLKYAFITYRSNGVVQLAIETDASHTDYYTLPSTSGARVRTPIAFRARRGKLFRIIMDGLRPNPWDPKAVFRVYGEDTQFFAKPWVTGNTYTDIKKIAPRVGGASYLKKEGGT